MNIKPVAWMQSTTKELPDGCECMQSVSFFKASDNDIPLYIHPPKTLTDEKINEILKDFGFPAEYVNPYDFAKAILKKASEK